MTSIIIALWNQLAYTQQCVESIEAYTPEDHEIIFIDNGSTDGTFEWLTGILPKHQNYKIIKNETNLGWVKATNQGIELSRGEYICFLNNDTVVSKEWLKGLIDCVESAKDVGVVGARSNYVSGPQIVTDTADGYDTLMKYQVFAENYRNAFKGCYIPYWRIVLFCGLVKRSVLDKVGLFDERFYPGNFADDDWCLRACLAGYRNLICSDVFIHHHGSVSFKSIDFNANLAESENTYNDKWHVANTISVCMIAKDEQDCIARAIKSVYDVADEIIVIDTGSVDETKRVAASCGEKVRVYDFPWVDDFSTARNFANSKARMAWIFSLDADEYVTGLADLKAALRHYYGYRIVTRNYTTNPLFNNVTFNTGASDIEAGIGWFPSTKIRLWPNDDRITFEYPVHEVVENSVYYLGMGIIEDKNVVVHHYGRMDEAYDDKHGEKYYHLLHKQFESGKNDLRSVEQLAIQAQGLKRYDDAKKFWHEVIKIDPEGELAPANLCHCWAEEGNWQEARRWAQIACDRAPGSRDAAMNLALCEFHHENYDLAEKMCRDLMTKHPYSPLTEGLLNATIEKRRQIGGTINGDESICGAGS